MLISDYLYLAPVLSLLAGALLILLLDLLADREQMGRWGWKAALASGLLALGSTFLLGDAPVRVLNVLAYDVFTAYVWRLLLGALVLLILLGESYVRSHTDEPGLFYALLMFFAAGALLVAASTNTMMLLLAVELLSIAGTLLVGFLHADRRATQGAIRCLVYGSAMTAVMALGFSWFYGLTGTTDYALTSEALSGLWGSSPAPVIRPIALVPVLAFVLVGLVVKTGSAPFHHWLPGASDVSGGFVGASAPVAASLAILPKVAGFAALVRLTLVMLPEALDLHTVWRWPLVGILAVAAMLWGSLLGLRQHNIKRLMAFSGIAQLGYVLIGVVLATEAGLSALLVALTAYVLAEMGTFTAIAVVSQKMPLDLVSDYRGLYRRAPLLALGLLLFILSLFGMPGTAGFIGKLWLFTETFRAGYIGLLILAALSSVISLGYYGRVVRAGFMDSDAGMAPVPVPAAASVVLIAMMVGVLVLGIFPNTWLRWAQAAAQVFFASG